MVWVQNNKGSALPLSQKEQIGLPVSCPSNGSCQKTRVQKIVELFFWAKLWQKTPYNYRSVLWFRGICGNGGGIGGSLGIITTKANFRYDKQGVLKRVWSNSECVWCLYTILFKWLHFVWWRTFLPIVQKLKTKKKTKVDGQDGSIQQFLPTSLQVAPVPKGDSWEWP